MVNAFNVILKCSKKVNLLLCLFYLGIFIYIVIAIIVTHLPYECFNIMQSLMQFNIYLIFTALSPVTVQDKGDGLCS